MGGNPREDGGRNRGGNRKFSWGGSRIFVLEIPKLGPKRPNFALLYYTNMRSG
jgi:hypothetical protein